MLTRKLYSAYEHEIYKGFYASCLCYDVLYTDYCIYLFNYNEKNDMINIDINHVILMLTGISTSTASMRFCRSELLIVKINKKFYNSYVNKFKNVSRKFIGYKKEIYKNVIFECKYDVHDSVNIIAVYDENFNLCLTYPLMVYKKYYFVLG